MIIFIWKYIGNKNDHCHGSSPHHYILSSSQSCHLQQVSEIKRPLFLVTHTSSLLEAYWQHTCSTCHEHTYLQHMPGALSQLPENAACYTISRPSMSLFSFNSQGNNHLIIKQSRQLLTTLYSGMLLGWPSMSIYTRICLSRGIQIREHKTFLGLLCHCSHLTDKATTTTL